METLYEIRDREATLTDQIAELRDEPEENRDQERIEDLLGEREEVRAKIAAHETTAERAEQEVVSERW